MAKKAVKKKTSKASKKLPAEIMPIFPKIVIQRINKGSKSKGKVIVVGMELEETPYATIFEVGENADFEVGELVMVHAHCGHDFVWDAAGENPLNLTIIEPDDVVAKIEGSPAEKSAFVKRAQEMVYK